MKRRIKYQNKEVIAKVIPFDIINDNWSEFSLNDGTTIRIRPVVNEILRLEDEYSQSGDPVYVIMSNNLSLLTNVPEHLRREDSRVE